jgi:hypothetical protein
MCNRHIEDGGHLFFKCKEVKQVWREMALEEQRTKLAEMHSAKDTMTLVLNLEADMQLRIVLLLRLWWQERNAVRDGEHRRRYTDLAFLVHKMKEDFLEVNKQMEKSVTTSSQNWRRPSGDWVKINSDGVFSAITGVGAGVLLYAMRQHKSLRLESAV